MSPAFYKGKLINLVEIARESVRFSVDQMKSRIRDQKTPKTEINLITEFSDIFVRILLMCALGEDVSRQSIDYWVNGKCEKVKVSYSLRETFGALIDRMANPHIFFFPFFANIYITPYERDIKANALALRELMG